MIRALICLLGLTPSPGSGEESTPLNWSPDGRWLAYTTVARADRPLPTPGWIFESGPVAPRGLKGGDEGDRSIPREITFRIYATSPSGEGTTLLEESRGPLTAPSWSPDGRSLAFGRLVTDGPGTSRFELVIQDGPRKQRTLTSRPVIDAEGACRGLVETAPAWSPDGRYLAISGQTGRGLSVIRADNGRLLKAVSEGIWPSWSPDSTKLAFIGTRGTSAALFVLDESFGPSRLVCDLGQTYQAPWWARDGKSVVVATRRSIPAFRRGIAAQHADLVRVNVGNGQQEVLVTMSADADDRVRDFRSVSFSLDRDGEELFFSADVANKPNVVFWYRPRTHETHDRTHAIDTSVQTGSLSACPGGKPLALRFGPPGISAPAALWSLEDKRFNPLVPDDATRVEWVALLITTARHLLRANMPPLQGLGDARASILPARGEIPPNAEVGVSLNRIGRIGRPLCDRPDDAAPVEPSLAAFLSEARFFFDYLRGDDSAALRSLELLDETANSPDHRLRLLCLRGQIFLGLDQFDRARDVLDYLRSAGSKGRSRLESTVAGFTLTTEPLDSVGWASRLARGIALAEKSPSKPGAFDDAGPDHPNPDAPMFGPVHRLEPERNIDPEVFAPLIPRLRPGGMPDQVDPEGLDRRPRPPVMPRFRKPEPPR